MNSQVPQTHFLPTANKKWPELQYLVCGGYSAQGRKAGTAQTSLKETSPQLRYNQLFGTEFVK